MKFLSWSRSSILESIVRLIGQGLIQMAIIVLTASPGGLWSPPVTNVTGIHTNALQVQCGLYKCHESTGLLQGFQARSRGGRWSRTLKLAQKRSLAGRWSWAAKVGPFLLQVVTQQRCNGHYPCDSALAQQLRSTLVAAQWRGDTTLTLPLFWRRSTVSPVFLGRYPRSSPHSEHRFPALSSKLCQI